MHAKPPIQPALDPQVFRRLLMRWYRQHARALPWRGVSDPYLTWVSEIMLQQTRVAAVLEHYARFTTLFPTLTDLAQAAEAEVLAAWSGLGYYRRARMLHKAARLVIAELGGVIPGNAEDLRRLPGIGEYTGAAIASIGFGESVAVVDGNLERVLLRLTGRTEDTTATGKAFLRAQADALVPSRSKSNKTNAPGDHNQAMMELGATICLPRGPLCLQCPVYNFCQTRGEHLTAPRRRQQTRAVAYLLETRGVGDAQEVLLERRPAEASLMGGMLELPPLPLDAVEGLEPLLRVRHSITDTNYQVSVYSGGGVRKSIPAAKQDLEWHPVALRHTLPLTGLARKVIRRWEAGLLQGAGQIVPRGTI